MSEEMMNDRGSRPSREGRRNPRTSRNAPVEKQVEDNEFEERIIEIRRVTKVVAGGKNLSFRVVASSVTARVRSVSVLEVQGKSLQQ
jgi:small subunit ribosomal protein S5